MLLSLWRYRLLLAVRFSPFALVFCLFAFYVTGWMEPSHPLRPEAVKVEGSALSLDAFAERYRPSLATGVQPEKIYFSASDAEGGYYLSYFLSWPEERHPSPTWDFFRSTFRYLYFGGYPEDVECVEFRINAQTGTIDSLRIGEGPFSSPGAQVFGHRFCQISFSGPSDLRWRHAIAASLATSTKTQSAPALIRLDEETFRNRKFSRRKQGFIATRENYANTIFIFVICGLMGFYFFRIQIGAKKKDHLN